MKNNREYIKVTIDKKGEKQQQNGHPWVYDNEILSIDGEYIFEPSSSNSDTGVLEISMSSRFLINDGQHRKSVMSLHYITQLKKHMKVVLNVISL